GLLICPCGARFEAIKGGNWLGPSGVGVYVCAARRRKGPSVCTNDLALPIGDTETMFLDTIEGEVLAPSFVARVLDSAFAARPDDRLALETERARLAREIEHL